MGDITQRVVPSECVPQVLVEQKRLAPTQELTKHSKKPGSGTIGRSVERSWNTDAETSRFVSSRDALKYGWESPTYCDADWTRPMIAWKLVTMMGSTIDCFMKETWCGCITCIHLGRRHSGKDLQWSEKNKWRGTQSLMQPKIENEGGTLQLPEWDRPDQSLRKRVWYKRRTETDCDGRLAIAPRIP